MIGKVIGIVIIGGVGIIIAVMGWLIWKKEKLSLMHDYHVNKVSAENRSAFCRLSGGGRACGACFSKTRSPVMFKD